MAEGQALGDAIGVGGVHDRILAQPAAALGVLGMGEMPAAGMGAHDLAGGGDLEPFRHGLSGFDAFRTSHKFISIAKERRVWIFICCVASAKY